MKALLGTKLGMTQLFGEDGNVQRVTLIKATPNTVTQVKTVETDGYNAVQIGFGEAKNQAMPQEGHLKKAGVNSRHMQEVRLKAIDPANPKYKDLTAAEAEALALEVGATIDVTAFEVGDVVAVTGTSKGKGFAGVIKRHNFARGRMTHGSHQHRGHGSIGAASFPAKVFKGMRMAGHMGGDQDTVKNLKVIVIDAEQNIIAISGAVPGPKRGTVMVRGI